LPCRLERASSFLLLAQVQAKPLPCSPSLVMGSDVYDLHAAHVASGATDSSAVPFVPAAWRPFNPRVPQIPFTFPVRRQKDEEAWHAKKPQARKPWPPLVAPLTCLYVLA
jgi:hypothetical protein